MAGYVSPDKQGQTVFSHTLQELRTFITLVDPSLQTIVRRVDSRVSDPNPDTFLSQASLDPHVFNGGETDLAGAISLFSRALPKPVDNRASPEEEDEKEAPPPRFHILVTDGVQSTRQGSANENCTAGSDQFCVRKRILALLGSGWGGYVIGLRSEFKGKVYSEITHGVVSYESRKRDPQSYRPFYIYVFSPDRIALDALVSKLKDRLRPLLAREDGMRTLALTSGYTTGALHGDIEVPKESKEVIELSARETYPPRFTIRVDVATEKSGPKQFTIKTTIPWSENARDSGTPKEMAELLYWELEPIKMSGEEAGKGKRYPEVKLVGQEVDDNGSISLRVSAQFPRGTGEPEWRIYRLAGRLNTDKQVPPWVLQWSTNLDTTIENANRTLYLESALLGLWNNSELQKQRIAEIYLRVGAQ